MKSTKVSGEYWRVELRGVERWEAWQDGVLDDVTSLEHNKVFMIGNGKRHAYSSGKWVSTEEAILLAKKRMPENWHGDVIKIELIELDFDEILDDCLPSDK